MRVNLFRLRLVQRDESVEDVITSGSIIGSPYVQSAGRGSFIKSGPNEDAPAGDLVPS